MTQCLTGRNQWERVEKLHSCVTHDAILDVVMLVAVRRSEKKKHSREWEFGVPLRPETTSLCDRVPVLMQVGPSAKPAYKPSPGERETSPLLRSFLFLPFPPSTPALCARAAGEVQYLVVNK